ncbi:uncharacterized protein N7506_005999 [Penicillium brevicompactum]|uniref:uncharacterized protein n=1 Tax=Penicillium brevicompactum TaxID=5074 RepID=UPI0025419272|nr:uncharacterized protein N7506_005999 [Penicillium brevicompactum]KAJ5332216.1 hypothetical protein N7506_005999 [Penicillium brevicompactum]
MPLKTEAVARANVQSCLRDGALEWYTSELSDLERAALRTFPMDSEHGWLKLLKPDVRNARSATAWAQSMLRLAQAAEITDLIQQLRMIWMRIDPSLQRDITEPVSGTTVAAFMQQLDQRYGQILCHNS